MVNESPLILQAKQSPIVLKSRMNNSSIYNNYRDDKNLNKSQLIYKEKSKAKEPENKVKQNRIICKINRKDK